MVRAVANGVSEGLGWFSGVFHLRMRGYGLVMRRLPGWFSLFQCGKRKRTSHDVPKNKMKKSNTGSTNLFLLFRFRRLRGAKVVFFFVCSGEKLVFFCGFQSVFSVFAWWVSGFFRLVSAKSGVGSGVAGFKCGGCGF